MKLKQIGRLAMRHEGNYWNAYWAKPDTMEGAVLLGSIAMTAVTDNSDRKDAFMQMMKEIAADIIKDIVGVPPQTWDARPAPEHEKAGHS